MQTHLDGLTLLAVLPGAIRRAQLPGGFEPDLSHLAPRHRTARALEPLLGAPRLLGALRGAGGDAAEYDAFVSQLVAALRGAAPAALGSSGAEDSDADADAERWEELAWRLGAPQLASKLEDYAEEMAEAEGARLAVVVAGGLVAASAAEANKSAAREGLQAWFGACEAWEGAGVCDEERDALMRECPGACRKR